MATKDAQLKKTLMRDGIIAAVTLIALAVGGYFLSDYDDDSQAHLTDTQGALDKLHGDYEAIKRQLGSGYEIQHYYEVYSNNHNVDFTLNRETATALLTSLREKYHMENLTVTIAPISDMTGANTPPMKTGFVVKSEVKLTFGALTDNDVYGFIYALQKEFPGIVLVDRIALTRISDVSRNVLVDLSQHKLSSLVKGDMSFVWLGIRPKPEEPAAPPATPTAQGTPNAR